MAPVFELSWFPGNSLAEGSTRVVLVPYGQGDAVGETGGAGSTRPHAAAPWKARLLPKQRLHLDEMLRFSLMRE